MPDPISIGLGAAGLIGGLFGSKKPKLPPPRNAAGELRDSFGAIQGIAPDRLAFTREYLPEYTGLDLARDRQVRGDYLSDVATRGGDFVRSTKAMNPEVYGLIDRLTTSANEAIGRGGRLSAAELADAQQQARAAYGARGGAEGQDAMLAELLNADRFKRARLESDRAFATNAAQLGYQTRVDPFESFRQIPTMGYGASAYEQGDPTAPYFSDVYNTNFNAAESRANAAANNRAGLYGAGIGAFGNIAGSYLGREDRN